MSKRPTPKTGIRGYEQSDSEDEKRRSDARYMPDRLASMTITNDTPWLVAGPFRQSRASQAKIKHTHKKRENKIKKKSKTPAGPNAKTMEQIRMDIKKAHMRANANRDKSDWCYIYVGNLNKEITERDLARTFRRFGHVHHVEIRVTQGCPYIDNERPNLQSPRYATIEFYSIGAAQRALDLNGYSLLGTKLAVCLSPGDLPEHKAIEVQYAENRDTPLPPPKSERAVKAEPTIMIKKSSRRPLNWPEYYSPEEAEVLEICSPEEEYVPEDASSQEIPSRAGPSRAGPSRIQLSRANARVFDQDYAPAPTGPATPQPLSRRVLMGFSFANCVV